MKILICPDKFKGSLSAMEACQAIGAGLQDLNPDALPRYHPMADGGEGSLEVLAGHLHLHPRTIRTTDPLGREIPAKYFTSTDAAFIELASASGLVLLSQNERNPMLTSTEGTGKLVADALENGFREIYLFLGGSATNDAGMGIAHALGFRFLDKNNRELEPIGANLQKVRSILTSTVFDFQKTKITLLCDVTNPLYGTAGAAQVYARQKGATDEQIEYLDEGLRHFSQILQKQTGLEVGMMPGCGAAGGIGACLTTLVGAQLQSGFAAIADLTGLESQILAANLVISGEGKLDAQSLHGKVVSGVAALCKKHDKPLILLVGKNDLAPLDLRLLNPAWVLSISEYTSDLADAMGNGAVYLRRLAGNIHSEFVRPLGG